MGVIRGGRVDASTGAINPQLSRYASRKISYGGGQEPIVIVRMFPDDAMDCMDRIDNLGIANELPFHGFEVVGREVDADHTAVKVAEACARAVSLGLTETCPGFAFYPQVGEWTSVSAWTAWREFIEDIGSECDARSVTYTRFGLDIEDYPNSPGNPPNQEERPPDQPLVLSSIDASAMGQACIDSGFQAMVLAAPTVDLFVYPCGKPWVNNLRPEHAAAMAMRAAVWTNEPFSFVWENILANDQSYSEAEWLDFYARNVTESALYGMGTYPGLKNRLLRPRNAAKWATAKGITGFPPVIWMYADYRTMFDTAWFQ